MKSKLTNGIIFALAIFGGLFIFLMVVVAVTDNNDTSYNTPVVSSAPIRDDTKTEYVAPPKNVADYIGAQGESDFMTGCGWDAECACLFEYLDSHFTNEEFLAWANEITEENIYDNPVSLGALVSCVE